MRGSIHMKKQYFIVRSYPLKGIFLIIEGLIGLSPNKVGFRILLHKPLGEAYQSHPKGNLLREYPLDPW